MVVKKCFVPICRNTSHKTDKIFIAVPQNRMIREKWFAAVRERYVTKGSVYCCEDHFNLENDAENWMQYKMVGSRIRMKPGVLPHKFIHIPTGVEHVNHSQLSPSTKKRQADALEQMGTSSIKKQIDFVEPGPACAGNDEVATPVNGTPTVFLVLLPDCTESVLAGTSSDKTSSTSGNTLEKWAVRNLDNDDVYCKTHVRMIEKTSKFYLGLPQDTYSVVDELVKSAMIKYTDVLICLKKIRLGDANTRLADDFGVSASYIEEMFNNNLPILAAFFKNLIIWQDAEYIASHLPKPFRFKYKKCQSIIDCFEIEIQEASDPVKQALTWSDYKKCDTMKYMVSAAPHGIVNFVSRGYGGGTSDKVIFETCGYLDNVPPGCVVMADCGFEDVEALLQGKNCKLVRLPSVAGGQLSSKNAVRESREIVALRIYIERVIKRLREFSMLKRHACIDNQLLHLYDCIVVVAAGITNLR